MEKERDQQEFAAVEYRKSLSESPLPKRGNTKTNFENWQVRALA